MAKRILIDLTKCRNCKECKVHCVYLYHPVNNGINTLRELASFHFTCRQCEDSPCIEVCPVNALEKKEKGIISRATNLCVACKSCVAICPFGTLMNDFFEIKTAKCDYCSLDNDTKSLKCIDSCPEHAISLTELSENEKENIFLLNENVLVKEYKWENLKHETKPVV